MGTELRYPKITGKTEGEQIAQMKSYLYQLVGQLEFALKAVGDAPATNVQVPQPQKQAQASGDIDPVATFGAIKALIIKSADIISAYSDEISKKLVGQYVALSEFGDLHEYLEQNISANSSHIENAYTYISSIESKVTNIEFTIAEVNACIKSGKLYEKNGLPIYGLEIGQKNTVDGVEVFNKFARFTSDRLSFFDQNENEVAYISDYRLYIRNIEVLSSFKIGGIKSKVMPSGDVVKKWEGE